MAKKATEETALISADLQKSLDVLLSTKESIDKIGENCLQIKVVDESTLSIAQQNLSKANDMVKFIEEKRVEVKEPHLQNCKTIDSTCKELAEGVIKAVAHLKEQIKQYAIAQEAKAEKARIELEKKQKEDAQKLEAETKRKEDIQKYIREDLTNWCKKAYDKCTTIVACDIFIGQIEKSWPGEEKFQEFIAQADDLKSNYLSLAKIKRQQIEQADTMSQEQKDLIKEKEELAKQKQALAEKEAEIAQKEVTIAAENAKKLAEEQAKKDAELLAASEAQNKTSGLRKTWKYELVEKSKLVEEWIALDETAVKEYMKVNKDKLKSGEVINGVKFYQEISVSA